MTNTPRSNGSKSREAKAMEILEAGKVALHAGRGFAVATGTKGESYRITKQGCECKDFQRRQQACKHVTATAIVCGLYREAQAEAKATGKVRLPAIVAKALANATSAPAPKRVTTTDDQSDLFNPYTLSTAAA